MTHILFYVMSLVESAKMSISFDDLFSRLAQALKIIENVSLLEILIIYLCLFFIYKTALQKKLNNCSYYTLF